MKQKLLLHHCCAVCTPEVYKYFIQEFDITSFWFNPNIYPEDEHVKRLEALKEYADKNSFSLIINEEYSQAQWFVEINNNLEGRCKLCYNLRLRISAGYAKKNNINNFSTTLLVSPHQKHEIVRNTGKEIEDKLKINFIYKDFRDLFYRGKGQIRQMNLYMQKYCGCSYSKEEREKQKNAAATG